MDTNTGNTDQKPSKDKPETLTRLLSSLANKVKESAVASEYHRSDRWVRSIKSAAMKYPPETILEYPEQVREFLIKENERLHKRLGLRAEIAQLKKEREEAPKQVTTPGEKQHYEISGKLEMESRTRFDLHERHLHRMYDLVGTIRSCLEHPTLAGLPDYRELLEVRGCHWQLDPTMWFYLSTPDFTDSYAWEPEFPMLESHMKDSPFWKHLEELRQAVKGLEQYYDRAVDELSKNDEQLKEFWLSLKKKKYMRDVTSFSIISPRTPFTPDLTMEEITREWGNKPSRTPSTPGLTEGELTPYYDVAYAKSLTQRYGVMDKGFELEEKLDELYEDLLEDEIDPLIAKGHCHKCPTS